MRKCYWGRTIDQLFTKCVAFMRMCVITRVLSIHNVKKPWSAYTFRKVLSCNLVMFIIVTMETGDIQCVVVIRTNIHTAVDHADLISGAWEFEECCRFEGSNSSLWFCRGRPRRRIRFVHRFGWRRRRTVRNRRGWRTRRAICARLVSRLGPDPDWPVGYLVIFN